MAEGKSFASCLQNILGELGKAEAYPDADPQAIQSIREIVVPLAQQGYAAEDPMAQMAQMMGPEAMAPEAMGAPMPVEQAPGRLPGGINARETAASIERDLANLQRG